MLGLIKRLNKTFKRYDVAYVAVDIHETVLKPTWSKDIFPTEYYPYAKKTLQMLSKSNKFKLILWTSSYPKDVIKYLQNFENDGIQFNSYNSNTECKSNEFACFDDKMYFDLGFDDRFGFNPYIYWFFLYYYIKYIILWREKK